MLSITWTILCESAVYILIGFLVAGLLEASLSGRRIADLLRGTRKRSVLLATLVGAPLPLCSCSVLPTAVTLRRKGASKGATLSFLISTPETSITSILLTYALLGPLWAIFRPFAACVTALIAGLTDNAVQRAFPETPEGATNDDSAADAEGSSAASGRAVLPTADDRDTAAGSFAQRLRGAMRYAFVDLFDDIFGWILLGIIAAGVINALMPPELIRAVLGSPLQSMLLMLLIGIPLYVCAEASTPIAAVLLAQGMNPGAALVFLLAGPATNIGSIGVLHRHLGRRTVIIYLATIVLMTIFMGFWLNGIIGGTQVNLNARLLNEPLAPAWLKTAGAIVFLLMGAASARRRQYAQRLATWFDSRMPIHVTAGRVKYVALLAVVAGYLGSGFFTVRPGQVGVVRRFGAIQRSNVPPGLHYALPVPIDRVDRVPVQIVFRSTIGLGQAFEDSWSLVGDENIADIELAAHWSAAPDEVLRFQYGVTDHARLVRSVLLGAAREVFGGVSVNTVFTAQRRQCEQEIARLVRTRLAEYGSGIHLRSVHILDAHAPPDVHAAFRDVASAVEDRSRTIHQARAVEARLIPQARGEAVRQIAEAKGYLARTVHAARGEADRFLSVEGVFARWPRVTRQRLQFEMTEQVLPALRKYIKPPATQGSSVEIWFLSGEVPERAFPV